MTGDGVNDAPSLRKDPAQLGPGFEEAPGVARHQFGDPRVGIHRVKDDDVDVAELVEPLPLEEALA